MLLQAAVDSLSKTITSDVVTSVSSLVTVVLGAANKVLVDFAQKLLGETAKLPSAAQAVLALVFAQLIAFLNLKFATMGLPALPTDLSSLATILTGVLIWVTSMGWHSFAQKVLKK